MTLVTLLLALVPQTQVHEAPAPGPRRGVAGLAGIHLVARQDFAPGANRLTATYVFPDRARWSLEPYEGPVLKRELVFRHGELAHRLTSGASSVPLAEADRDHVLLQMELRRAALLYPDGFAWKSESDGTQVSHVYADSCCLRRVIGTLCARRNGEHLTLEARDLEGTTKEALTVTAWQELEGRRFPRELDVRGSNGNFHETIESLTTRVHYLDLAFLPGDRRKVGSSTALATRVIALDLVPMAYLERALPAGTDWEAALAAAKTFAAEVAAGLEGGLTLDPVPTFEIDSAARPLRCLLRLARVVEPAPAGFTLHGERLGLLRSLEGLERVVPAELTRLTEALPPEAEGGRPYVRVHAKERVEMVLPLLPR